MKHQFMQNEDKDRGKSVIKQEVGVRAIRRKGKDLQRKEMEGTGKGKGRTRRGG